MRASKQIACLIICAGLMAGSAQAERADRTKPINLESDRMQVDDVKRTSVFEGNVLMTQGTLSIRADKITVRQDKDGHQYGSASGNPAVFRQKRDGAERHILGPAQREPADEVRGNYISYDSRTEYFTVTGDPGPGASASPPGRVRAVIQPRTATGETGEVPATVTPKQ